MPSGPKKRMRARRKKQGSPTTDGNSDRETEGLSIAGSMDVDELEQEDVDTPTPTKPGNRPILPNFGDKDAVSSQTEEWVRVSDFEVGTPTSQTGENEPLSEDTDISSVRRSLDKLAEWETVSGHNLPDRKAGSINSLEEEPSEVEIEESVLEGASGHSSESFTHLPSPHPVGGKERESDTRSFGSDSSSNSSSSSSSDAHSKPPTSKVPRPSSAGPANGGGKVSSLSFESVVAMDDGDEKQIIRSNGDPVEKEVVHEGDESASIANVSVLEEGEMEVDEGAELEGTHPQSVNSVAEDRSEPSAAGREVDEVGVSPVETITVSELSDVKDINEADSCSDTPIEIPVLKTDDRLQDSSSGQEKQIAVVREDSVVDDEAVSASCVAESLDVDQGLTESSVEPIAALTPADEKEISASGAKDISEVDTPLGLPMEYSGTIVETPDEDKEVLSLTEESGATSDQVNGTREDEKILVSFIEESSRLVGALTAGENVRSEDKEVSSHLSEERLEENSSITSSNSIITFEEKEAASSSVDPRDEGVGGNVPEFEFASAIHEKPRIPGDPVELTLDTVSSKPLAPLDGLPDPTSLVEERCNTVESSQPAKNGILTDNMRPHLEPKSLSGCCGVIYWLLGKDQ